MQRFLLSATTKHSRARVPHPRRAPHGIRSSHAAYIEAQPATTPLFQRVPPWWARWTWALIACDIFLTGSAIELTWNNWYKLVEDFSTPPNKKGSTSSSAVEAQPAAAKNWEPRPTWQRAGLCLAHLGLGVGCAVALLVTQTRFVRTFAVLPPLTPSVIKALTRIPHGTNKPEGRVFIQCAHNWRKNGQFFPLSHCSLEQGRDPSEILLRVRDERGHWHIGLEDSVIHGGNVGRNTGKAQQAILSAWKGKKIGKFTGTGNNEDVDKRWKSGPVKSNR
ncbi:hypothetical protein BDN72DRAFT_812623 [Pluteus cervinus]|uniref:Uncharacterized protein n=1 Tax=Pluteus cervinus TaxID=181527 RepID=A0ACD3B9A5_9AGAR|nr:hypothetical protein BDN72DRAFT_812623 [Pluteus cervinus]